MTDTRAQIDDVTDTALWIAAYRAIETERSDALFRDPLASKLAGDRGRALAATMPGAKQFAWQTVVRTCVIDAYVVEMVAAGFDTVLNLGAGLDTRPHRLALPAHARWVEVDYETTIAKKNAELAGAPTTCKLERIAADLSVDDERRAVLARVAAGASKMLVLTEGVIAYLESDDVAKLARDLRAQSAVHAWIVDYTSPFLAKQMQKRRDVQKSLAKARLRFAPDDWHAFFAGCGWREREMRYLTVEGQRRGRPPPIPLLVRAVNALALGRFNAEVERMMGYALLEPAS